MCANPTGGKWQTSTAPWTQNGLLRMLPCSLCSWYIYLNLYVCIKMVDEHKKLACIFWGHVCYLYILNAPGSSAKHTMSPDSRASSAKSSSSSSSFCCCHGSMPSQVLGAVPPTKTVFSHEAVVCVILWQQQSPSFLTVVLLQHFFVQQLGHHIIFHIHQEKDVWEIDRAPGLTSKPWPSTLTYYTVHTLWCQPKKLNRGDSCMQFYLIIYQPVLWLQHVACRTSISWLLTWSRIAWLISESSSLFSNPQKNVSSLTVSASVQGK